LAKPGLPGLSSNSSEQTTQVLMGNAISTYFNGNASGQLLPEQGLNIPAASQDAQNQYVTFFDSVEDDVIPDRETPQPWAQLLIAAAAKMRIPGQQIKALGEEFGEAVGNFQAAALARDVAPDVVQVGFRRSPVGNYLAAACSAASRARPRCFTSLASSSMVSCVMPRP
jgi:hypothetical protein